MLNIEISSGDTSSDCSKTVSEGNESDTNTEPGKSVVIPQDGNSDTESPQATRYFFKANCPFTK